MLKKKILFSIAALSVVAYQPLAIAGTYDALCGGIKCKITLDAKGLSGPNGFVPSGSIAQWYTGGGEEHNAAASAVGATAGATGGAVVGVLATCWTVILCPIGLIGGAVAGGMGGSGAGKSADYYFTIIGYNQKGKKIVQGFNFINKKPVGRLMQELPALTGLAMGEMRSIDEIKENIARGSRESLPGDINSGEGGATSTTLPDSLDANEIVNKAKSKCWSVYAKENPGMAEWAEANPSLSEDKRAKYDEC